MDPKIEKGVIQGSGLKLYSQVVIVGEGWVDLEQVLPLIKTARFCIFIDYRGHHRKGVAI